MGMFKVPLGLKQKGIGKYLGSNQTNLSVMQDYEKYVDLTEWPKNNYIVSTFNNPIHSKNEDQQEKYAGPDKDKAIEVYDKIVRKDQRKKLNFIHKIFSRN